MGAPGLQAGRVVAGRYRLEAPLGRGGQGEVWTARPEGNDRSGGTSAVPPDSPPADRLVVLKALSEPATPGALARLEREVQRLRALEHPALPRALEVVAEGERAWLVLEHREGKGLLEAVGRDWRAATRALAQVLRALERVHAQALVHLDVKPEHVLVAGERVALLDLGLAATHGDLVRSGTPGYAAPEVARGWPVDRRADLYSVGATLWHAATGARPGLRPDPARAPAELQPALRALLAPDRTLRPSSANEALALLAGALGEELAPEPAGALPALEGPLVAADPALETLAHARVALVVGPHGAGRTRLLREAAARAEDEGALVLLASVADGPRGAYGALGPALTRLGVPLASASTDAREDAGLPRARVLVEAGERVVEAARARKVVLAVDDAHLAPEEALDVLVALARTAAREPAARSSGAPAPRVAVWLTWPDGADRPELARLARDVGEAAVRVSLVPPPSAAVPARRSAAAELLRLAPVGSDARAALELLAVGGALGDDALGGAAAAELHRAGLLRRDPAGRWAFASSDVRAAAAASIGPERRRELARELLSREGRGAGDAVERARLALATDDPDLAAPVVLEAARAALATGAAGLTQELLQGLLGLQPPAGTARAARLLLAEAAAARGDLDVALEERRHVVEDEAAPALERARAAVLSARAVAARSKADGRAQALVERAEALAAQAPPDAELRCEVENVRAQLLVPRAPAEAAALAREAMARARAAGRGDGGPAGSAVGPRALGVLGLTLGSALVRLDRHEEALAALEQARADSRAAGNERTWATCTANLALCLMRLGRREEASRENERARAAWRTAGDLRGLALSDATDGLRLLRQEKLREGISLFEASLPVFERLDERDMRSQVLMNRSSALLRLGDLPGARADLEAARALATTPEAALYVADMLAYVAAEQGDAAAALTLADEAARAREAVRERFRRLPSQAQEARVRARAGQAARGLADAEAALREAEAEKAPPPVVVDCRLAVAEAALAAGKPEQARDAGRLAAEGGAGHVRVDALATVAAALLRLGQHREAERTAREAEAAAGESALARLDARVTLARALTAQGATAEAARLLADAVGAARVAGLVRIAREAEAALGEATVRARTVEAKRAPAAADVLDARAAAAARVAAGSASGIGPALAASRAGSGVHAALPAGPGGGGLLGRVLQAGPDAGHMLDLAIGLLVEATGAERGVLVMLDPGGRPSTTVARNIRDEELAGPQFAYSRRLVEEAARTRAPIVVKDALEDPRFAESDSVADLQIRSVLAAPAPGVDGAPAAVLYLDVRKEPDRFGPEAAELAARLVAELGPALSLVHARARLERDVEGLRAAAQSGAAPPSGGLQGIVGESEAVRRLLKDVQRAARSDIACVVSGESGAGKELVARAVHALGPRAQGPFVVVACGAVPDELIESELFGHVKGAFTGATRTRVGLIEAATGGTLLLDDAAAMSPLMQAKLLRVLEDGRVRPVGSSSTREVDVRVIAATQDDLERAVEDNRFRGDLYYRLHGFVLRVPPLRDRKDDIPLLVDHFLSAHAEAAGRARPLLSDAAREALLAYAWPGNVRELENEVRRLVALGVRRVLRRHLSPALREAGAGTPPVPEGQTLEEALAVVERELIARALREAKGNISEAARRLGIERTKLLRRMRTYGIDKRGRAVPPGQPGAGEEPDEGP